MSVDLMTSVPFNQFQIHMQKVFEDEKPSIEKINGVFESFKKAVKGATGEDELLKAGRIHTDGVIKNLDILYTIYSKTS